MAKQNGKQKEFEKDGDMSRGFADSKQSRKSSGSSKRSAGRRNRGKNVSERRGSSGVTPNSWNSITWWARLPDLLRAVGSIPYPYKPGMTLEGPSAYHAQVNADPILKPIEWTMPGIASIYFHYSVGYSDSVQDPASICCAKLYERVRATYSGTLKADATDMFMYLFAIDQIHAYIAYLKRIYRTLNLYTPENRLFPQALFEAQVGYGSGTDGTFVEFLKQKPNFEYYINQLVRMINNWYVPSTMDIFERHRWMNEHVYSDAPTLAGQMYVMVPLSFFKIETDAAGATCLNEVWLTERTPEAMFRFGVDLIQSLAEIGNSYDMRGYFEKSYSGTPSFMSALLMPEEVQVPVFVPETLAQIHNITLIPQYVSDSITQDKLTHTIYSRPRDNAPIFRDRIVLDSYSYAPDVADTVLNTRLAPCTRSARPGESPNSFRLTCGTEVCTGIRLWLGRHDNYSMWQVPTEISFADINGTSGLIACFDDLVRLMDTRAWQSFPRLFVKIEGLDDEGNVKYDSQGQIAERFLLASEINNPTSIEWDTLANMNRVCLYSIFDCFGNAPGTANSAKR